MRVSTHSTPRLWIWAIAGAAFVSAAAPAWAGRPARALSLEQRIQAHRAIEDVLWRHRIWPSQNPGPKPALDAVFPSAALRERVEDALRKSNALERRFGRPLTADQLQAEVERMARRTRQPAVLEEIFDALDRDPLLIAECLARPALADRLLRTWHDADAEPPFEAWWRSERAGFSVALDPPRGEYEPVSVAASPCTDDSWASTESGAPDPRTRHLAVWTGSEMIVWGGSALDFQYLANGGRYDPATDTWSPMSTGPNAPSGRESATAVWTGTAMIVWGGDGASGDLNDGARYDPTTDTWTPTSQGLDVPAPRELHSAVWTGTEMIVWGGRSGSEYVRTGGRYDPSTNSWRPTRITGGGVPQGRFGHTAVWTGTEMIVWGGVDHSSNEILDTGGRYDPLEDRWNATSTHGAVPVARVSHTAVWTGGAMIIWGGETGTNPTQTGARYDPVTDTWTSTSVAAGCPSPRSGHASVWTGSRMIVWGGADASTARQDGALYDPSADTWTATGSGLGLPAAKWDFTAVWTGDEMIVWGGGPGTNTGARYRPLDGSWIPTGRNPDVAGPREGHAAVWTGAEMIVWGGRGASCAVCPLESTGGRYVPATDQWIPTAQLGAPQAREGHRAVWTGTEMIVWGGDADPIGEVPLKSGGRYRPVQDLWLATNIAGACPTERYLHTAVWSGTRMIVWGGRTPTAWLKTGGQYDPAADAWAATSVAVGVPEARQDHTALWAHTKMLVWGGAHAIDGVTRHLNDGAGYDPSANTWTALGQAGALPSGRRLHAAVWTGGEMIVWGGQGPFASTNTGGVYDPTTGIWRATSLVGAPSPRRYHGAAWTGAEMVVWGGDPSSGPPFLPERTGGRYDPLANQWRATSGGAQAPSARTRPSVVQADELTIVWGGSPLTYTGATYCAAPPCVLATWYFDQDLDGRGQAAIQACAPPPGWVAQGGDCNDADAGVQSAPGAIGILTAEKNVPEVGSVRFSWSSLDPEAGVGTNYDVARGPLATLRVFGFSANESCVSDELPDSPYAESGLGCPADVGDGCWYLVRAQNACGAGPYGASALDTSSPCP